MADRQIQATRGYLRSAARLRVEGTAAGRALGRAIRSLASAANLPGASDAVGIVPPSSTAWVRKVPGTSLWLWYSFTDDTLALRALTAAPPPPPL